jgi:hypothetical protein
VWPKGAPSVAETIGDVDGGGDSSNKIDPKTKEENGSGEYSSFLHYILRIHLSLTLI